MKNQIREDGEYWVMKDSQWVISEFCIDIWDTEFKDNYWTKIDERRITDSIRKKLYLEKMEENLHS